MILLRVLTLLCCILTCCSLETVTVGLNTYDSNDFKQFVAQGQGIIIVTVEFTGTCTPMASITCIVQVLMYPTGCNTVNAVALQGQICLGKVAVPEQTLYSAPLPEKCDYLTSIDAADLAVQVSNPCTGGANPLPKEASSPFDVIFEYKCAAGFFGIKCLSCDSHCAGYVLVIVLLILCLLQ